MLENLRSILQYKCQLKVTQPVLVGVSGGPDSLCLLDILWQLRYPVIVAHLNHRLRPEADLESQFVEKIAKTLGVPFVSTVENVANYAEDEGFSIEEAARILRYRFLFKEAKRYRVQAVAVGHNADDQIETMLMHLLRGSGLAGLMGMTYWTTTTPWDQEIPLVRPLLGVWRDEILSYLAERDLQPVYDLSNLDNTYFRNRLRNELIPFLEEYNPQIRQVLWRTTNILQEDLVVLERMIQRSWQECLLELGEGYVSFDYNNFREQSLGIQRHVFRRAIAMLQPGLRDIDYETIERAVSFLVAPTTSAQCDLKSGLRLLFEDDRLWIASWETDLPSYKWPQLEEPTTADIEVPGKLILGEGWELHTELVPEVDRVREQAFTNTNPFQAWLDASKLQYPLSVRVRQSGDRFKPLGMKGRSMKLAEFMVNVKIPRRARAGWPLVCSGDEVLWIPGFRIGHPSRVTVQTKEIVQLSLVKKKLN